jgi:hypothetical protein
MKKILPLVAIGLLFAAFGQAANAQQNNNQNNNNNNVTPIAPRVSRPARIRDPLLRLTPAQFIARLDVVTNTSATAAPTFGSGPDGRVSLGEFIAGLAIRNRNINVQQATDLFDLMDRDVDGFLTLLDFNQSFIILGGGT